MADQRFGWSPNPEGVRAVLASLPHPGQLAAAAPHWLGDGMTGDLLPFLSYYEVEVPGWKAKTDEPPYAPQTGNNCTSEGTSHGGDLLQFLDVASPDPSSDSVPVFHRICTEATYAFGLSKAGMRGDNGCFGGSMAQGASEIGFVPYSAVDGAQTETRSRLVQYANNPAAVISALSSKAIKVGKIAKVSTWEELCAALANRCIVTVASDVGYEGSRDSRGIIRRRGSWPHQMFYAGIIRSDGVETALQMQSWGPTMPSGPTPFRMPKFSFRVVKEDVQVQLAADDSWAYSLFPGFERKPLPPRFVDNPFAAI